MFDLIIANGTIVTVDPDRRIFTGGAIGILDGQIAEVYATSDSLPETRETIDATGHIVLPGIVDTHGHAGHSLTRGLGEGLDEGGWSHIVETLYFRTSDLAFWRNESRLAAWERLRFGVTTSVSMTGSSPRIDKPDYALAAATGYREFGLRHIVAVGPPHGPYDRIYRDDEGHELVYDLDHALQTTETLIQAFRDLDEPLLDFYVGPSAIAPLDNPDPAFRERQVRGVSNLVKRYGTGLHTHAYAGQIAEAYRIDPEIFGPHALLAHCAGISDSEIDILARTGTNATSGPLTHAYIGARFPVYEAMEKGVNVVFSTDGSAPDRSFDLLDQARIGAQLQRVHFNDANLLPLGKLLEMITIDAARALGLGDIVGSIEAGKRADIITIRADRPHLAPQILPVSRVISHATGHDVSDVIVDGVIRMRGGVIDADETAIVSAGKESLIAAWERAGFDDINAMHPATWSSLTYRCCQ